MQPSVKVIIPAFNEEASIGLVVQDIPALVEEVIVVSNGSTDQTEAIAKETGATVLQEPKRGYGYACLKGMAYVAAQPRKPDIIVFLDGDYSDYPQQLTELITPIVEKDIDFVIGARVKRLREVGAMTFPQRFGNWLATSLMKLLVQDLQI